MSEPQDHMGAAILSGKIKPDLGIDKAITEDRGISAEELAEATGSPLITPESQAKAEEEAEREARQAFLEGLQVLASECLTAEMEAARTGDPRDLVHATFQIPVEIGNQPGPRVHVLPGLFGTAGVIVPGREETMVSLSCQEVRRYIAGVEGPRPVMGVDPGALARGFLEALGHKDLDDGHRERLKRELQKMTEIAETIGKGEDE